MASCPKRQKIEESSKVPLDIGFTQQCTFPDVCDHIFVKIGNVVYQICKAKIVHESDYFAKLLDSAKWKEGEEKTVEIKEASPEDFTIYIRTLFPPDLNDFEALNPVALRSLFRCADRFQSMHALMIIKRSLVSLEKIKSKNCREDCILVLQAYSGFNMEQCTSLHQKVFEIGLSISNVQQMQNSVKASILLPIVSSHLDNANRLLKITNLGLGNINFCLENAKSELETANNNLQSVSRELESTNRSLESSNRRLETANRKLGKQITDQQFCTSCNRNTKKWREVSVGCEDCYYAEDICQGK